MEHLDNAVEKLTRQIERVACLWAEDLEWRKSHAGFATKQDLLLVRDQIMSKISDWAGIVGPKLDRVQTGLDSLQALVKQLQDSPGQITPEDQALLDQIQAKVDAIATDADGVPTTPPTDPNDPNVPQSSGRR